MSSVLRTRTRAKDLEDAGGLGGRPLRSGAEAGCGLCCPGNGGSVGGSEVKRAETSFAETSVEEEEEEEVAVVVAVAVAVVVGARAPPFVVAAVAIASPRSVRVVSKSALLRGGAGAASSPGRGRGVTRGSEEEEGGNAAVAVAVEVKVEAIVIIIGCSWWLNPPAAATPATAAASAP